MVCGWPRQSREMLTGEWKKVLDKIFDAGIPHVCFTGGEATLRDDLSELIAYAEDLGLVTGLLTNGCRLSDAGYVKRLVDAGLDHVQITLESHVPQVHNQMVGGEGFAATVSGIKNAVAVGLYTVTNTTLTRQNMEGIGDTVRFLHELGITRLAMNSIIRSGRSKGGAGALSPEELSARLAEARDAALELGMNLIWYSPTRYCELNPVALGLGIKSCTAGLYNMCIEPDGSVLPCQSYFESVGNILQDPWPKIWEHPLLKNLRSRSWVDDDCRGCAELGICGGVCPLEAQAGEVVCTESLSNYQP